MRTRCGSGPLTRYAGANPRGVRFQRIQARDHLRELPAERLLQARAHVVTLLQAVGHHDD